MANLVLKITRDERKAAESQYIYKDIDAFSDKYAVKKVDMLVDIEAVKASIRNIFMWSLGEEILYPQFGNGIKRYLYEPLDDNVKTEISHEVKRCVEDNDKRVVIDSLGLDQDENDELHSAIRLRLNYHVVGSKGSGALISDTITITDKAIGGENVKNT